MNAYSLAAELEELRESVRRLAEERIAPHAAEVDESEVYPWASWEAWRDAGFAGLAFPAKFGGQDGGFLAHAIAVEEVARVCASSSLFTFISKLAMTPVLDHGSDDLHQRYVTRVASGSILGRRSSPSVASQVRPPTSTITPATLKTMVRRDESRAMLVQWSASLSEA